MRMPIAVLLAAVLSLTLTLVLLKTGTVSGHHSPEWRCKTTSVILAKHGYRMGASPTCDDARSQRAIRHWQQVNGLTVDGIIGPVTLGSLGLAPAQRGTQVQVNPPPPAPAPARPTDGDCASWEPFLVARGMPFDQFQPIMWRESRCSGTAHNHSSRTRDHSHGVVQVNVYTGALATWYANAGFSHDRLHTWDGALDAAAWLYSQCGLGPWRPPYSCKAPS